MPASDAAGEKPVGMNWLRGTQSQAFVVGSKRSRGESWLFAADADAAEEGREEEEGEPVAGRGEAEVGFEEAVGEEEGVPAFADGAGAEEFGGREQREDAVG